MSDVYFSETQWFRKTAWIYFILLVWVFSVSITVYGLYSQLVLGIPYGTNSADNFDLLFLSFFGVLIPTLLLILFMIARLDTFVDDNGLYFRFIPFINKFRKIDAIQILSYKPIEYKPIMQYSGWGIRYNMKSKTICYNVRGKLGLYLELKNGKRILFGSQQPYKFKSAIDKLIGDKL